MKIIGAVLATVLVGLFAFQNCQQSPHPNDISSKVVDSFDSVDLQGEKISEVNFPFSENETVTRAAKSYTVAVNKNLQVFLPSGKMILTSDLNDPEQEYCLTETLVHELVGLLKSSQVCKKDAAVSEDKVCAMVYTFPYAVLVTEKNTYKLGEAPNSCGAPVDLCGDQVNDLHGFIASVKKHYKALTCPE